ncbi:MAG: hypothetical protein J1E77_07560 [Prevotella sp.]|nr:hypothetical protein [Prevotella sp.]
MEDKSRRHRRKAQKGVAQNGQYAHKKADFVHFILQNGKKVVPLHPLLKVGNTFLSNNLWL